MPAPFENALVRTALGEYIMRCSTALIVVLVPFVAAGEPPADVEPRTYIDTVYYDVPNELGELSGGVVTMPITIGNEPVPGFLRVSTIRPDGSPTRAAHPNRIHVVFVGDGYTASELATYADQVESFADWMFNYEPYTTYRPIFSIHRVDIVSNDSGVDHDPTQGIYRDTALDMGFWCGGTKRLLCVSMSKAKSYAAQAPGDDLIVALANSSKYGGAGYSSSDLATASARHSSSADVVVHENGHALADLADEYTYGGPTTYTGSEPSAVNVTKFTAQTLIDNQYKWYRWLGESFPQFDGAHGMYEGGNYSRFGIYRPSNNSMMRALGRPFNMPSVEAHIISFYLYIDPIDTRTPAQTTVPSCETLWVDPIDIPMQITWSLQALVIAGADAESLDTCAMFIPAGQYQVTARVRDTTPWVRDEAARDQLMTQSVSWNVVFDGCPADFTTTGAPGGSPLFGVPDGDITGADIQYYVNAFIAGDVEIADITTTGAATVAEGLGVPDGDITGADIQHYVNFWLDGCG